mmetsp:Transcript_4648/g.17483  ORF Transcript_4648/g.17483 Transcript_4648/m.17483 type:complete len:265 (-) Transcript_4648:14-808(-)
MVQKKRKTLRKSQEIRAGGFIHLCLPICDSVANSLLPTLRERAPWHCTEQSVQHCRRRCGYASPFVDTTSQTLPQAAQASKYRVELSEAASERAQAAVAQDHEALGLLYEKAGDAIRNAAGQHDDQYPLLDLLNGSFVLAGAVRAPKDKESQALTNRRLHDTTTGKEHSLHVQHRLKVLVLDGVAVVQELFSLILGAGVQEQCQQWSIRASDAKLTTTGSAVRTAHLIGERRAAHRLCPRTARQHHHEGRAGGSSRCALELTMA